MTTQERATRALDRLTSTIPTNLWLLENQERREIERQATDEILTTKAGELRSAISRATQHDWTDVSGEFDEIPIASCLKCVGRREGPKAELPRIGCQPLVVEGLRRALEIVVGSRS